MASSIIRKTNIQGDIWPGLPKRFQSILFFQIHKPTEFKQRLKSFIADSKITTAADACKMKDTIAAEKERSNGKKAPLLALPGINIAFSATGLHKLGKFVQTSDQGAVKQDRTLSKIYREKQLKGGLFEMGMYNDLVSEGWDNPAELRETYKPLEDGEQKIRQIDGVLSITSSLKDDIEEQVRHVCDYFLENGIVSIPYVKEGNVRPGDQKGREHFGYQDGLSQPQIKGLDDGTEHGRAPQGKEPKAVKPGLILCGHDGDPMGQPEWAKDGSFLVIRELQQKVPEYEEWLQKKGPEAPFTKGHPDPAAKLGAYLMGRWKNGTPVHENPEHDDDPNLYGSNNFDFEPREKHDKCPFGAHIRKMRPRADLENDHAVILRRGIPYGPEVSQSEKTMKRTIQDRGLLFTCYQSDLRNGFNFLTTRWASNYHFPHRKHKFVGEGGPGFDAIAGQRLDKHPPRSIALPDGKDPTEYHMDLESWVVHRGGEYFFSPSISAMRDYLTAPSDYDIPIKAKL